MAKFDLKRKVEYLRRKGASLTEIMLKVGISKSTASLWCREINLTAKQKERLKNKIRENGNIGRMKGAEINRRKNLIPLIWQVDMHPI